MMAEHVFVGRGRELKKYVLFCGLFLITNLMMIQNGNRKNTVVHTEIADSLSHNIFESFCLHLASSLQ
jgi:hypothetical protein